MLAYKNVFYEQDGVLVQNTSNKIIYTDVNGKTRVKTNPSYADFAKVGMFPKHYTNSMPEYDPLTQEVEEKHARKGDYFEITYVVKDRYFERELLI